MPKELLSDIGLQGVWTALVTPFRRGRVDRDRLARLVREAVAAGITGVVPLGSTGEAAALDERERAAVIGTVVAGASGRLKVMVGAGTNNTRLTIQRVGEAAALGADAALIVTPYYNKPTPAGQRRHFLTVAEASPIPLVLYHIPSRCGVGIPLELVLELAQHHRIIGIKEAGGDLWRSSEIARCAPRHFVVLSGDDSLTLPLLAVGAVGTVAVVSNLAPVMLRRMVVAALKGDFAAALRIHRRLAPLLSALSLETNPAPIKEALKLAGRSAGDVRPPLAPVTAATRKALRRALEEVGQLD